MCEKYGSFVNDVRLFYGLVSRLCLEPPCGREEKGRRDGETENRRNGGMGGQGVGGGGQLDQIRSDLLYSERG